jgi:hypothetical protein
MEQLRVIGTEEGSLVLATQGGDRYTLPVDDVLRAELRRTRRDREAAPATTKPSPREVQAQIRAGLSAEEVAQLLGAAVEDVRRYEAPVLAEREYIVGQALSVPVLMGADFDAAPSTTFGTAVRAKLTEAGASGERWTSWKEASGWIVKLIFLAGEVERDARWSFDPRRSTLSPLNADATQLSRQGSLPEGLIPRLRALDTSGFKDDSRFDSGAFGARGAVEPIADPARHTAQDAAIKRAPDAPVTSPETADLLEALRRRRGQRTAAPTGEGEERKVAPVALFDTPERREPDAPVESGPARSDTARAESGRAEAARGDSAEQPRRKGRTSMPSWDEIVFGARTDES